jgi:hypothetical protein
VQTENITKSRRAQSVQWRGSLLSDPSGSDLTLAFSSSFFSLLLLLLFLLAVSESSINSHIYAISALQPTYHISPVRGQRQGSSGDDQDKDKDTHKDEYKDKDKDKDRTFKKKVFLYI